MVTLAPGSKFRMVGARVECQRGHVIASDADFVWQQGRRRCRQCKNLRQRQFGAKVHAAEVAARPSRSCLGCGVRIAPNRTKYCSRACSAREQSRIQGDRQRAEFHGVAFEPLHRFEVYERDGWACGLCSLPVSWFLSWPHDWSPVLDHRLPLSQGGDHVEANVQLAHAICNAWKRDLGPEGFERALLEMGGVGVWGLARA